MSQILLSVQTWNKSIEVKGASKQALVNVIPVSSDIGNAVNMSGLLPEWLNIKD